jgi:hypothetical protein
VSLLRGEGLEIGDTVELRLEPAGARIDGSAGKALTRTVKFKRDGATRSTSRSGRTR